MFSTTFRATAFTFGVALLSAFSFAQYSSPANEHRALIENVIVTGLQSVDSNQLNEITGELTSKVVGDDREEVSERLRMAFQDHGYFEAKVNAIKIRPIDALAHPKTVTVEADVTEGSIFRVGGVQFSGNYALSSDQLRDIFSLHKNELFQRGKIAKALEDLREAYGKLGYLNFTSLPGTEAHSGIVDLKIDIDEDRQYHMGKLALSAKSANADELRSRWHLEAGKPFDDTYPKSFFEENRSLFPVDFDFEKNLTFARDCDGDTVTVFIDLDPQNPAPRPPACPPKTALSK